MKEKTVNVIMYDYRIREGQFPDFPPDGGRDTGPPELLGPTHVARSAPVRDYLARPKP